MRKHARLISWLTVAALAIPLLLIAYSVAVQLYRIRHPKLYELLEPEFAEEIQSPSDFLDPETGRFCLPGVPLGQSYEQTLRDMDLYREFAPSVDFSEELAESYCYWGCYVEILDRLWELSFDVSAAGNCYGIVLSMDQQSTEDTAALFRSFLDALGTPQYGNYHPEDGSAVLEGGARYGCIWVTADTHDPVTMLGVYQFTPENSPIPHTSVNIHLAAEMDSKRRTSIFWELGEMPY